MSCGALCALRWLFIHTKPAVNELNDTHATRETHYIQSGDCFHQAGQN